MMKTEVINVEAVSLNSYVFFLCIKKTRKTHVNYVSQSHFEVLALSFC
jgi:hypothetical protein